MFVQQSDDHHFDGKRFQGTQNKRDRAKPPQYLLPLASAARQFIINTIQSKHEVTSKDILTDLQQ